MSYSVDRNLSEKLLDSEEQELQKISDEAVETKNDIIRSKVLNIVYEAMHLIPFGNFSIDSKDNEMHGRIVEYIVSGDIKTHKNLEMDKYINNLLLGPFGWKLKYLYDHKDLSLEENLRVIQDIEKKTKERTSKKIEGKDVSLINKGLEWLKGKILGLSSGFVDLSGIPEKVGGCFGDMLARAEKYIGKSYVRGSMDCSAFLSKIFCAGQGIPEKRIGTSGTFSKYPQVNKNDIRCGDIIYQSKPAHVELVVSKPFVENGKTYLVTIGSSSDTNRVDPMFDASGKTIIGKNGVGYRKRQIAPNPRHSYTFHRPPYEQWAENRKT